MKTAEEVAAEIMIVIAAKPTWGSADLFKFEHLITQALTAYAEERVKENMGNPIAANPFEWFCKTCRPLAEVLGKQASSNARAEELEEAAKIAEKWIDDESTPPYQRKGYDIAKAIRALKEKP